MTFQRKQLPFESNFAMIPNEWLRDARLSRKARGLLAELMSHKPGWSTNLNRLIAAGTEGREALQSAVRELKAAGYLTIERPYNHETHRLGAVVYTVSDPSLATGAATLRVSNTTGNQADGKHVGLKKTSSKKTSSRENHGKEGRARDPRQPRFPSGALPATANQIAYLQDIYREIGGLQPSDEELAGLRAESRASITARINELNGWVINERRSRGADDD